MLRLDMRQITWDETASGFEPVAELSRDVVGELERRGIIFSDQVASDEAGPTRWAAIEMDGGTQLLLVHHCAHQAGFLELRARASDVPHGMVMARFLHALDLMPEVFGVAEKWSAVSR
jgi:hypothetical protein